MIHSALSIDPEITVLMAFAGLAFGLVYFAFLRRSVTLLVGGNGWFAPPALALGRIGAAAAFLFMAAKLGAAPLLSTFIGFLMARTLALRAESRSG